jgi:hypothetical protein
MTLAPPKPDTAIIVDALVDHFRDRPVGWPVASSFVLGRLIETYGQPQVLRALKLYNAELRRRLRLAKAAHHRVVP